MIKNIIMVFHVIPMNQIIMITILYVDGAVLKEKRMISLLSKLIQQQQTSFRPLVIALMGLPILGSGVRKKRKGGKLKPVGAQ